VRGGDDLPSFFPFPFFFLPFSTGRQSCSPLLPCRVHHERKKRMRGRTISFLFFPPPLQTFPFSRKSRPPEPSLISFLFPFLREVGLEEEGIPPHPPPPLPLWSLRFDSSPFPAVRRGQEAHALNGILSPSLSLSPGAGLPSLTVRHR